MGGAWRYVGRVRARTGERAREREEKRDREMSMADAHERGGYFFGEWRRLKKHLTRLGSQ